MLSCKDYVVRIVHCDGFPYRLILELLDYLGDSIIKSRIKSSDILMISTSALLRRSSVFETRRFLS